MSAEVPAHIAKVRAELRDGVVELLLTWGGTSERHILVAALRSVLGRGMRESHVECDIDCDVTRAAAVADAYLKSGEAS